MALCTVSRDVTKRKRIEEALKESEERFRSLTQNASDVVAVIRADGITRYVSPSIEHVLGYKPEERMDASSFELASIPTTSPGYGACSPNSSRVRVAA